MEGKERGAGGEGGGAREGEGQGRYLSFFQGGAKF